MKKVLILEDNAETQEIFKKILGEDVELLQAHNLKEAEDLYEEHKESIDLIALDGNVPVQWSRFKNAVELAKHIRTEYRNVLYSISLSDEIRNRFRKIWFDGILLMKHELVQKVLDILDKDEKIK